MNQPDPTIHVEQDPHPDGAIFGVIDLARPMVSTRTVLDVEQSKAKSLQRGLEHALSYDRCVHPHVWPWSTTRPKTVKLVEGKVVPL